MDSDNEPEIIFKWTNSCRLCLSTDSNIDLFSQESSQEVLKKLRSCFNLLIYLGDPMPRKLCTNCLVKLDDWCEFKESCTKVESELKKRLENYRKIDFVQNYFDKCARFSSPEVVSSSKVSATHEEINSNLNEDDNRSNSTNSSQTCGSSNYQEPGKIRVCTNLYPAPKPQPGFSQQHIPPEKREIALQVNLQPAQNPFYEQPSRKETRKSHDDEVVTIENVTGSASALWDVPLEDDIEEITEELIHHEIIIKQEINSTTCTNCGIDFPSDEDYAFHSCNVFQNDATDETDYYNCSVIRKKITPWKCEACGDYYQTKAALNEHYTLNCKGEQYGMVSCKYCKRKFVSKCELYQHQICHVRINFHLTEDDLYCCRKCPSRFCSEEDFNKHYKKHLVEVRYSCNDCGRMFTKKDLYLAHVKHHNTSKTEMLKLRLAESLIDTSSQESASSQSSKRCFRCGKFFADEKELEKHRLVMHKNPTPFSCRLCNHKFSARSQLLFHIRSHRGKKPGTGMETSKACGVCSAKFMLESDLQSHMMTHSNSEEKQEEVKSPLIETSGNEANKDTYLLGRYKCSLCPRIFARLNSVPKHMRLAHNGQSGVAFKLKRPVWVNKWSNLPLPYKKVKFHCNLCPKYFYSKDNLNLHVERGHAIKKEPVEGYEGEEVSRFVRNPGSGEKQCIICKNIYSKKYIHQHMKRAHPDYKRAMITGAPVVVTPLVQNPILVKSTEERKPEEPVKKRAILKCRHCFRLCYNDYAQRRHEESCARKQKSKCTVCGIRIHSNRDPEKHMETCKSVRCRKCNKIFFKYVAFLSHTCTNVRGDKFRCEDCSAPFLSRDLLDLHMKEEHDKLPEATVEPKKEPKEVPGEEPPELLVAKVEPQEMLGEEFVDVEIKDLPEAPPPPKKKKKTPLKELWEEESNKIVIRNNEKFYCTYCDVFLFSSESRDEHQKKHPRGNFYAVQIDDNLFQCTICDKKYSFRKHCLAHINYHKKNSNHHKRLATQKKNVETPNKTVAQEQKMYQCSLCPSSFMTESSFNIHSYYVHSNDVNNVAQ